MAGNDNDDIDDDNYDEEEEWNDDDVDELTPSLHELWDY